MNPAASKTAEEVAAALGANVLRSIVLKAFTIDHAADNREGGLE